MGQVIVFRRPGAGPVHMIVHECAGGYCTGYVAEWLCYGDCVAEGATINELVSDSFDTIPAFCQEHGLLLPSEIRISSVTQFVFNPPFSYG